MPVPMDSLLCLSFTSSPQIWHMPLNWTTSDCKLICVYIYTIYFFSTDLAHASELDHEWLQTHMRVYIYNLLPLHRFGTFLRTGPRLTANSAESDSGLGHVSILPLQRRYWSVETLCGNMRNRARRVRGSDKQGVFVPTSWQRQATR